VSGLGEVRIRNVVEARDADTQVALSERLTKLRQERFGVFEFSRLVGVTHNNLWHLEHRNQGGMSCLTVERRAAPLGLRLTLDMEGLPDGVEDDFGVMVLAASTSPTVEGRALTVASLAMARLATARVLLGVTQSVLALRMGVSQATVQELFQVTPKTRIASIQRIARVLGARVVLDLTPLNGESDVTAP
jgi:predicted DNA-binding protein (UPF0251 family)